MAAKKENVQYYEYYSSIKEIFIIPKDPAAIFDIVSETATVKEVPGLTWFLRAKQIKKPHDEVLRSKLTLTLAPSPGLTPTNLSYAVEGLVNDQIVSEGFKPLPSSQKYQRLRFSELFGSAQSREHQFTNYFRLDSVLLANRKYLSCTVKLTVRSPEFLFSHENNIVYLRNDIASPRLADFTIRIGISEFKTHKHILLARSPVFCAMLANANCAEVQNSEMTITDATRNALEMFLKFLYTASMPVLELSLYMEVLVLAEKYQVMELKKMCELNIAEKMKIQDSVHDIYRLAFTYNCSIEFQTKCFDLVKKKFFRDKYINPEMINEPEKVLKLVNMVIELNDTLHKFNTSVVSSVQLRKTLKRKLDKS